MKKALCILLILVSIFSMAGCSGNSDAKQANGDNSEISADFPNKDLKIIVPYGAGGGTDLALRILADNAKDVFGQNVVVENKTGGSGSVGLTEALAAKSDGYTLATASVDLITLPLLGLAPPEVTRDAFEPIVVINGEPAAIIVSADAEWNDINDLINDVKSRPEEITIANAGMGNIWHLSAIGLEIQTGAKFSHIPYQEGAAQAIAGVLGGHVDAVVCSVAEAEANIKAGDLKVLGVAGEERLQAYPEIQTYKEQGIDLVVVAIRGLAVKSDTPEEIQAVLKEGFNEVINSEKTKEKIEQAGMTYMPLTSEEVDNILDSMSGVFKDIIKVYQESAQ